MYWNRMMAAGTCLAAALSFTVAGNAQAVEPAQLPASDAPGEAGAQAPRILDSYSDGNSGWVVFETGRGETRDKESVGGGLWMYGTYMSSEGEVCYSDYTNYGKWHSASVVKGKQSRSVRKPPNETASASITGRGRCKAYWKND